MTNHSKYPNDVEVLAKFERNFDKLVKLYQYDILLFEDEECGKGEEYRPTVLVFNLDGYLMKAKYCVMADGYSYWFWYKYIDGKFIPEGLVDDSQDTVLEILQSLSNITGSQISKENIAVFSSWDREFIEKYGSNMSKHFNDGGL